MAYRDNITCLLIELAGCSLWVEADGTHGPPVADPNRRGSPNSCGPSGDENGSILGPVFGLIPAQDCSPRRRAGYAQIAVQAAPFRRSRAAARKVEATAWASTSRKACASRGSRVHHDVRPLPWADKTIAFRYPLHT